MASNFEWRKSTPRATLSLKDVVKIPGNLSNYIEFLPSLKFPENQWVKPFFFESLQCRRGSSDGDAGTILECFDPEKQKMSAMVCRQRREMADRQGCLGQWGLTECRLGSIGRIGSRRRARRRRRITQKEGREKRRRTKKTKRTIDRCQLPSRNSISKIHSVVFTVQALIYRVHKG